MAFENYDVLCSGATKPDGLCAALADKTYHRLGEHNDLWVTIDALMVLDQQPLDLDRRRQATRLLADLIEAANVHGALALASTKDQGFVDILTPGDIYSAILTEAVVCMKVPQVPCNGMLPASVVTALRNVAAFVSGDGGKADPFDMSNRVDAAKALLDDFRTGG